MNQPSMPPSLSLPTPSASAEAGYAMDSPTMASAASASPETAARPEAFSAPSQTAPQATYTQQPIPAPQALVPAAQTIPATPAPSSVQAVATDDDLDDESLDVEWVSKAKAIVEQTQSDPYKESYALNQIKAEYLQRRHGKEIKVQNAQ